MICLTQNNGLFHKIQPTMCQRISDDSVSNFSFIILNFLCIVDRPEMRPRKDYDDYTTFVNDTFSDSKNKMLGMIADNDSKGGGSPMVSTRGGKHLSIMRDMKAARLLNTASQTTRNSKAPKTIEFETASDAN